MICLKLLIKLIDVPINKTITTTATVGTIKIVIK